SPFVFTPQQATPAEAVTAQVCQAPVASVSRGGAPPPPDPDPPPPPEPPEPVALHAFTAHVCIPGQARGALHAGQPLASSRSQTETLPSRHRVAPSSHPSGHVL